jgi:hypothetical protein
VIRHFCEYDGGLRAHGLNIEQCGAPATGKFRGQWFCEDHLDTMESTAELAHALANVSDEEAAESAAQFDADLEEL